MTPRLARQVALLRWSCALVLGTAAASKLLDLATVSGFLAGQMGPAAPAAPVAAAILIAIEALAAAWLVSPRHASRGGALAALMGLAFLAYHSANHGGVGCPCFGTWAKLDLPTGLLLGLMLCLCGIAVTVAGLQAELAAPAMPLVVRRWQWAALGLAVALLGAGFHRSGAVAARAQEAAQYRPAALPDAVQPGAPIPPITVEAAGKSTELKAVAGSGPGLISFADLGCGTCRATVKAVAEHARKPGDWRWTVVCPTRQQARELGQQLVDLPRLEVVVDVNGWRAAQALPLSLQLLVADGRIRKVARSVVELEKELAGLRAPAPATHKGGTT